MLWLITEDASGRSVERALRRQPCARVRVHERGERRRRLRPWLRPEDAPRAVLSMGGRVAFFDREADRLRFGWRDGCGFLAEVIEGRRVWLPAAAPELAGLGGGAWVLAEDLCRLPAGGKSWLDRLRRRARRLGYG
ncbi:MAG: hypothetical protein ACRC20_11325 [Segniliparus sp.]|uniref:hypothetical protein n=1 Tax=Segniliparus sp. TaxID=2804064 RepID=UPI003F395E36